MQSALVYSAAISATLNSVLMLNGNNFNVWKENILIVLGCMDIDLALRVSRSEEITLESSADDIAYFDKWDRSNRLSLMIMKRGIPEVFRGAITENSSASLFLEEIQDRFVQNDKAGTSTLLAKLISLKYQGNENIREYIMEMSNLASKLKALKLELSKDLLVHLILISLPTQYSHFKVSYNCQKEKWTLNELISFCVQEEERLKQERTESAHVASTSKFQVKRKDKGKQVSEFQGPKRKQRKGEIICHFCEKSGHLKRDCAKYAAWRAKKGLPELPRAP